MSAFLAVAWDLRYLLALIVGLCVGIWFGSGWARDINDRAEENRRRNDRAAFLTAVASDTDAPIHDRLAAEWLAAELDDPKAIERWLSA